MLKLRLFALFSVFLVTASAQLTPDQKIADFQNLAGLYAKDYAPYEWKRDVYAFDLLKIQPWLDQVRQSKDDLDFYDICIRYVAGLKSGGHDRFIVPSTFAARLNFTVDIYDGKTLIDSITRSRLPAADFPFQIGDELVSVDGASTADLITQLAPYGYQASPGAMRRSAAALITTRSQSGIPRLPDLGESASVEIRRQDGSLETYTIPWTKTGTPVTQVGPVPNVAPASTRLAQALHESGLSTEEPSYMAPLKRLQNATAYQIGAVLGFGSLAPIFALPTGFVQRLGKAPGDEFYTGTFQSGELTIGFIRIPSFSPSSTPNAIKQFETEMIYFQANTDGLIIDDMRNPGGSVSYLNQLAQRLMPGTFRVLGYEIRATSSWVRFFSSSLEQAKTAHADQWIIDLYQILLDDVVAANSQNRGRTGADSVDGPSLDRSPSTDSDGHITAYTKPLMVLVDEYSASGGDAFPATIQDNGRGLIFGMRTMGLGGTVSDFTATAYSEGITRVTESLMNRKYPIVTDDFPTAPYVENIGVRPDIVVDYMTKDNLLNRGASFVAAFTAAMVDLIHANR